MTGELFFVPLGGAGEIGMNLSLYGYGGRWLMVDLGIGFGDERTPGIDIMVPDPAFIAERRSSLDGIVITHAHEDHIGAVAILWQRLRAPVYATPFAAGVLRRKLREAGLDREVKINEVPPGGGVDIGPFSVDYIQAAHSIPEGHILAIRTPAGTVVHASDWKLDADPLVGPVTDAAAIKRIGDAGVLAMICDSTNVFVAGEAGSERAVRDSLNDLVGKYDKRVVITCFSSNVARLESAAIAARHNGRHAALIGRSLRQIDETARETGYLPRIAPFLSEAEAGQLPRERVLLLATGSQGEPRSALARIAEGSHPNITLERDDTVIFSSRVIPGNEKAIGRLQDQLGRLGVRIVTERDHFVHVSGHPPRDDLKQMYGWVRPQIAVPVHGEARHLQAHAQLAREFGVPQPVVVENGAMLRLAPGPARIVERVPFGRLAVDGSRLIRMDGEVIRARGRMRQAGVAMATVVLDTRGRLTAAPRLSAPGLVDAEADGTAIDRAVAAIVHAVDDLSADARSQDAVVAEAARRAVRRVLFEEIGKRPVTEVQVVRVGEGGWR